MREPIFFRLTRFFQRLTPMQIIGAGCFLTLLYALFSRGFYHSDEHYQILEYAHMKLFGTPSPEELPWEYGLKMRPGFQPLIAYLLGCALVGLNLYSPIVLVFLLQLLSGAISIGVILFFYRVVREDLGGINAQKWFLILSFFLWFMAFLHVHFNAEMLSGNLLLLLAALSLKYHRAQTGPAFQQGIILGIVAGLLFIVRFQMGFALLGFGLWWLVFDRRWKLFCGMIPGFLVMAGLGLLCDRWLYGEWCFTPFLYLQENILNGHMDSFGIRPWYYYLVAILGEGGVLFGLLVLIATFHFGIKNPRNIITWIMIPFLAVHLMVGHKELRFLFPLLFFAPYVLVEFFRACPTRMWHKKGIRVLLAIMGVVNILLIVYALYVPDPNIYFYDRMRKYCHGKPKVIALNLKTERTYYSIPENVVGAREVVSAFYKPDNLYCRSFDKLSQLEEAARQASCDPSADILILSENAHLADSLDITLEPLRWPPFPGWVVRHCNFNDWVSRSLKRNNIYRVVSSENPENSD